MWVKTAGLNQLEAKAVERDGKLEQLSILQSACLPEHPTLRLHKIIY